MTAREALLMISSRSMVDAAATAAAEVTSPRRGHRKWKSDALEASLFIYQNSDKNYLLA